MTSHTRVFNTEQLMWLHNMCNREIAYLEQVAHDFQVAREYGYTPAQVMEGVDVVKEIRNLLNYAPEGAR